MSGPLISIVICTYNRAHFLPQTLESVFAQSYQALEIVVVDDGSTDNTPSLMKPYNGKIHYFRQNNQGVAVARNTGLHLARGEYIAFHDDDDLMAVDRISVLYEAMIQYPDAVLALGDRQLLDEDGYPTGNKVASVIDPPSRENFLIHAGYHSVLRGTINPGPPMTLFKRRDAMRMGGFDLQFIHGCEDTDFFARLAKLGPIVYVPRVVCYCRKGHASLTNDRSAMHYSRSIYFKKHLRLIGENENELKKNLRRRLRASLEQINFQLIGSKKKGVFSYLNEYRAVLGPRHFSMWLITLAFKSPVRWLVHSFKGPGKKYF